MKKFLSFLFVISLLVSACASAPSATQVLPIMETQVATETVTEAQATPQALVAPQNTPLPNTITAPVIESPSIVNIQMFDEVFGWAVTEENIIRTNDGGVTWYNVTPANLAEAGYLVFTDFLDVNHAWVQFPDMNQYPNGGKLYRTSDGGNSWESFTTPFSGGSLYFVDANNGWMMADLGVGAGSMAVSVFQTSDGGATWNRTYTNDPNIEGAGDTLPLGGIKNMIVPLDADTAWIGGVVYAPGQTYFFRTDDNGKTWFNINLVLPDGLSESELGVVGIRFLSPTVGLLAIRITADTAKIIIYETNDGGNTWSLLPATFEGYGILETPSANEMVYYSADQFYITKDAGQTVQPVSSSIAFGDSVIDMSFVNAQTGWVITNDPTTNARALYKTTDSGANWTPMIP